MYKYPYVAVVTYARQMKENPRKIGGAPVSIKNVEIEITSKNEILQLEKKTELTDMRWETFVDYTRELFRKKKGGGKMHQQKECKQNSILRVF